ncbi:hypothetical protein GCM10020331_096880 [Ectobacillus funiculus]
MVSSYYEYYICYSSHYNPHISWREIYITFSVVGFVTWFCDGLVAREFDLVDLGNPNKAGLGDTLCYTFVPSSLAILYLNYLS